MCACVCVRACVFVPWDECDRLTYYNDPTAGRNDNNCYYCSRADDRNITICYFFSPSFSFPPPKADARAHRHRVMRVPIRITCYCIPRCMCTHLHCLRILFRVWRVRCPSTLPARYSNCSRSVRLKYTETLYS